MTGLVAYFIKLSIYSGVLYFYYLLALRNKRFHQYNRFYLLMSVAMSLFLPLINFEFWSWKTENPQVVNMMNVMLVAGNEPANDSSGFVITPEVVSFSSVAVVAFCLLSWLAVNIIQVFRFRRRYPSEKIEGINFIRTDLSQAPFSFFKNLFWKNSLDLSSTTGKQILRHEMTHIHQKHSWDKVFLRIVVSLFWLNPFYWLIQKELAMIHEFLADEKAIENKDAEAFALMLLQSQYEKAIFSPAQSFHYSPIKRRLVMLTTSKKPSFSYVRRILVLPLLGMLVLLFAFKMKQDESTVIGVAEPFTLVVDAGHGGKEAGAYGPDNLLEKDLNLSIVKKIEELAPKFGIVVKLTRSNDETLTPQARIDFTKSTTADAFLSIHVNNTAEKESDKGGIEVFIPRDNNNKLHYNNRLLGSSLIASISKNLATEKSLLQSKKAGVWVLDANPYPAVLIECGYLNNAKDISVLKDDKKLEQLANDILQGVANYANEKNKETTLDTSDTIPANQSALSLIQLSDTTKQPLYLLDGKEITQAELKKIDKNIIHSMNVWKDAEAIKKYGEKGKNGVIEVSTKISESANSDSVKVNVQARDTTKKPLYVVDGKELTDIKSIDPNDITSISVLKDDTAVKMYGEKGKNGVVIVTTKNKQSHPSSDSVDMDLKSSIVKQPDGFVTRADKSSLKVDKNKTPLIYVDGKETSKADFDRISQDDVASVMVWTGKDAINRFGQKGKDGVVEVTMKKSNQKESSSSSKEANKNQNDFSALVNNVKTPAEKYSSQIIDANSSPLILIDGAEKTQSDLNKIPQNQIQSISVWKDKTAVDKFGEKGKNGVLEVTMKKATSFVSNVAYSGLSSDTVPPSFPGGAAAWRQYLTKQLDYDILKKGPAGNYTVIVSFQVDENGNISHIKALNDPGYGLGTEAVRVIQRGPKWIPAKQNGNAIPSVTHQAITWHKA